MAVALRSVGVSPGAESTTCVIVKPVGLTEGDLMVAQVFFKDHGSNDGNISSPADWTLIRQDSGTTIAVSQVLYWKIADGDDVAASNFTFTGQYGENLGAIPAWTGHDPDSPINAQNGQGNIGPTSSIVSPPVTPSVANCAILLLGGVANDRTVSGYAIATSDPGLDEAYDFFTQEGSDCAVAMAWGLRPETTSTGNGTATSSGATTANVGQLVAIAPVPIDYDYEAAVDVGIAPAASRSLKLARESSVDVGIAPTADRRCVYHRYGWR